LFLFANFFLPAPNRFREDCGVKIFELAREHALIDSAASTLGWDQETFMPSAGNDHRAAQLSWLSAKSHTLATSDEWKRALEEAEAANDGSDATLSGNLREMRRQFDRATKLSVELVARESEATSLGKHAWAAARKASDFAAFAPHLETLLSIAREKADRWGYESEPYDVLLDTYERGSSSARISKLFSDLKPVLVGIAEQAVTRTKSHPVTLPAGPYPVEQQIKLNAAIAASLGFDFEAGRIDTTTHPFCTTLGPRDVRLTTRYDEEDFTSSLFGLAGSLVLGFLDLQAGQAQNRFFTELEDYLSFNVSEVVKEAAQGSDGRAGADPANARAATAALANLAEGVQGLVRHMRVEQQQIRDWVETHAATQRELKETLDKLIAQMEKR
jgi:hypothetical protein